MVIEARTNGLYIGSVHAKGMKIEDSSNVKLGKIDIYDAGDSHESYGFAIIADDLAVPVENIQGDSVCVAGYNGTATRAVLIHGVHGCDIGSIIVDGTIANVPDIVLLSFDGLKIGFINCKNPVGTGVGFRYDYDVRYAPQVNGWDRAILSSGHTGTDIELQSGGDLRFQYTSGTSIAGQGRCSAPDDLDKAVALSPAAAPSPWGSASTIKEIKTGRLVTITGRVSVTSVSSPGGALQLTGLSYAPSPDTQLATSVAVAIAANNLTGTVTAVYAKLEEGATAIDIVKFNGTILTDMANCVQAGTVFYINASYLAD